MGHTFPAEDRALRVVAERSHGCGGLSHLAALWVRATDLNGMPDLLAYNMEAKLGWYVK